MKLKDALRTQTKRTIGRSLFAIIIDVNRTLLGWFGYFKYRCRGTFSEVDGWVRMRPRSLLRKRADRAGRGRGRDHQRWTNVYFAEQGYFSLEVAHARACQTPSTARRCSASAGATDFPVSCRQGATGVGPSVGFGMHSILVVDERQHLFAEVGRGAEIAAPEQSPREHAKPNFHLV